MPYKDKEKRKKTETEYKMRTLYGIGLVEFEQMMTKQNGVCAICLKPETRKNNTGLAITKLSVDHCHETGKVRGLLCNSCNIAMGKFYDNPLLLRAALKYLLDNMNLTI